LSALFWLEQRSNYTHVWGLVRRLRGSENPLNIRNYRVTKGPPHTAFQVVPRQLGFPEEATCHLAAPQPATPPDYTYLSDLSYTIKAFSTVKARQDPAHALDPASLLQLTSCGGTLQSQRHARMLQRAVIEDSAGLQGAVGYFRMLQPRSSGIEADWMHLDLVRSSR